MADLDRVRQWADALIRLHLDPSWTFAFDNARTRAGLCNYDKKRISVSKLLAARYEDASPERREKLAPLEIEDLARLERDARARGHDHEAQLFRDAIARMGGAIEP